MITEAKPRFRITLEQDYDAENPTEWSLFKVVSFNRRHSSFLDPDSLLPCQYLTGRGNNLSFNGDPCEAMPWEHTEELALDHGYKPNPDILFELSYYEHGLCRWSLGGRGPNCRWDSVRFAGVLMWDGPKDERAWFDALTQDEKEGQAEGFLETYTDWCNGDVNVVVIEKWDDETDDWEPWEAVGGVYGSDVKSFVLEDMLGNFKDPEIVFAEDWYGW